MTTFQRVAPWVLLCAGPTVTGCAPPDDGVLAPPEVPEDVLAARYVDPADCDVIITDAASLEPFIANPPMQASVTACISGTLHLASTPPTPVPGAACGDDVAGSQFCLNPPDYVDELVIVGLDGPDGKATIEGGHVTFLVPPQAVIERLEISNLRLVEPTNSAILNFNGGEFEVTHVDVEGVIPFFVPAFNGWIQGGFQVSLGAPATVQEDIVGPVTFAYNTVDAGDHYDGISTLIVSDGMNLFGRFGTQPRAWTGTGSVHHNTVRNFAGTQIAVLFADVDVSHNLVMNGPFANDIYGFPAPQVPIGDCSAPNRLGSASGISVAGTSPVTLDGNVVVLTAAQTAVGVPACQAGVLLVDSTAASIEDTLVSTAPGVPTARPFVAARSNGNVVDGFVVSRGSRGVDLLNSNANVITNGLILKTGTAITLAGSSDNTFEDLLILGAGDVLVEDAASTGNTFDDVWPPP